MTFLDLLTIVTLITATIYSIDKANYVIKQQKLAESESEKSIQVSVFLKNHFKKTKPKSTSKQLTAQD